MSNDTKTISYDKTGRIRVQLDETLHTLRLPKYGEFKKVKAAAIRAQAVLNEKIDDLGIDRDDAAALQKHPELIDVSFEAVADAVRYVFNGDEDWKGLSDKELPADLDEWPTWLVVNTGLLSEFIVHWREVPLGRG